MNKVFFALIIFFAFFSVAHGAKVQIGMYAPSTNALQSWAADTDFGEPVDFVVEPLIADPPSNAFRAQKEIWFYCYVEGVGRISDCYITLNWNARESAAGHLHAQVGVRPRGVFSKTQGVVDQKDYYFKTTYSASDVSGIIDVSMDCSTLFWTCQSGAAKLGVGITGFVELPSPTSDDSGYELTGSDQYHPFNHFGQSDFIYSLLDAFYNYHRITGLMMRANDISLELGGLFDVQTKTKPGYDWTPPHRYHRLGQSIDTSIPPTKTAQAVYTTVLSVVGITPYHEDAVHWHLYVKDHY